MGEYPSLPSTWEPKHVAAALREENERLRSKAAAMVAKLDAVTEATRGIWGYLYAHGMEYQGPSYKDELDALRSFLSDTTPVQQEKP